MGKAREDGLIFERVPFVPSAFTMTSYPTGLYTSDEDLITTTGVSVVPLTLNMVSEVAQIHLDAFKGSMSARLGRTYIKAFLHWLQSVEGTIALVASDEHGKAVGYVIGAPLGYNRSMNRDLFWVATARIIVRPWLFFDAKFLTTLANRFRLILGFSTARHSEPELPEPTMSLVGIGTLPSARGKKIGLRLMQAFEARARELRMRSLRLSVYPDNTVARQLYERCGWQAFVTPVREKETMYYFRVLGEDFEMKRSNMSSKTL